MKTKIETLGMCDAERDMLDTWRRGRNCALGIICTLSAGYIVLLLIGGVK